MKSHTQLAIIGAALLVFTQIIYTINLHEFLPGDFSLVFYKFLNVLSILGYSSFLNFFYQLYQKQDSK
jgi:hypothetical protein